MIRKERGAITLFTVVICMFLLANVLLINVGVMNKNANQKKETAKISENYEVSQAKMEQAYQEVLESNEYPTYGDLLKLLEQMKEEAKTEAKQEAQTLVDQAKKDAEDLVNKATADMNEKVEEEKLKMYPVGSLYISTSSTNPSTFIGGTWERYGKGQTLVGLDENQTEFNTVGKTGGQKTVTLSEKQLPSHSHSIPALSGSTSAAGKHTHTYSQSSTSTGGTALNIQQIPSHTHTYNQSANATGSTAITPAQMPSHNHGYAKPNSSTDSHILTLEETPKGIVRFTNGFVRGNWAIGEWKAYNFGDAGGWGATMADQRGYGTYGVGHSHTISTVYATTNATGSGQGHTHSISITSTNTGATGALNGTTQAHTHTISLTNTNTSEVANHAHTVTTDANTTGATGNGQAVNVQDPYITVYMWKRTS